MNHRFKNYIGGEWMSSSSNRSLVSSNPANREDVIGEFQGSDASDAKRAAEAAEKTARYWAKTSGPQRGNVLMKAASILERRGEEFAQAITRECGKSILEARGETARAVALLQYYGAEASNPIGQVVPSTDPSLLLYTMRVPLGAVAMITPWNFPLAIPIWKMAPALAYGNTVVLKPASATPHIGVLIAQLWEEAELPSGVFNLITGAGSEIGEALLAHKSIAAVSFTGSTKVGNKVAVFAAQRGARFQLEMGGKNPVVVLPDADLEQAAEITVAGAMKYSGQKCTATSRAIVVGDTLEKFTGMVVDKVNDLKTGPGVDPENSIVPVIDERSQANILSAVERGQEEGGAVLTGGGRPQGSDYDKGSYVKPAVISKVHPDAFVACEEIFGPVLAIMPAGDFDEALDMANSTRYGLSAGVFTGDVNSALEFASEIEAGIVKINGETAGVEPQVPFGGMKSSSSGSREQGKAAVEFFTETKTIYMGRKA